MSGGNKNKQKGGWKKRDIMGTSTGPSTFGVRANLREGIRSSRERAAEKERKEQKPGKRARIIRNQPTIGRVRSRNKARP